MKKLASILSAATLAVGLMGGVAGATSSCPDSTIDNTGEGSHNTITCETTNETHVTCINGVYVVGVNGQAASTGDASGDDNTTGGVVVTGNATNDNNQTVQVSASCGAAVATTTTTTTPTTPAAGGKGAGSTAAPVAAALPETGSNTVAEVAVVSALALAGGLVASKFGVSAYRRVTLK